MANAERFMPGFDSPAATIPTQVGSDRKTMFVKSTDIVGYAYRAEIWCHDCMTTYCLTLPGNSDRMKVAATPPTEDLLDELAAKYEVDRHDEYSFDSDDFPKVVFRYHLSDHVNEGIDECHHCGWELPNGR